MTIGKKPTKWLGILSLIGGVSAVALMIAFALTGWGAPGTAAYRTYELLNRLMAFTLLMMAAGWLGLVLRIPGGYGRWGAWLAFIGAILLIIGNAAEFWLFSDLSYDCCNVRHVAWSTFLFGLLVTAIGATLSGAAFRRTHHEPRWGGIFLILAVPLFILGFGFAPFLGPAVLALALGWLLVTNPSSSEVQSEVAM
jgi:hypothetical protein